MKALVMRLMSASIAATAVITATRAALKPRIAAERPAIPSLALRARSMNAVVSARREPDPEHNRQASDLIFQGHFAGRPASWCALIRERERVGAQ